jgi:hypothetical protein
MTSFTDEMVKIAEWKRITKDDLKQLAKGVGVYGAGLGVGGALGYAARQKLLPHLLKRMTPKQVTALTVGTGALGGLVTAAALKKALLDKKEKPGE